MPGAGPSRCCCVPAGPAPFTTCAQVWAAAVGTSTVPNTARLTLVDPIGTTTVYPNSNSGSWVAAHKKTGVAGYRVSSCDNFGTPCAQYLVEATIDACVWYNLSCGIFDFGSGSKPYLRLDFVTNIAEFGASTGPGESLGCDPEPSGFLGYWQHNSYITTACESVHFGQDCVYSKSFARWVGTSGGSSVFVEADSAVLSQPTWSVDFVFTISNVILGVPFTVTISRP